MSMTTAPVTTGGSTLCSTAEPRKWIAHTDEREHGAGDEDRAGHVGRVATLGPDRRDRADEARRRAEIARDLAR